MSEADYQAALSLAQKKVARRKSLSPQSTSALSPLLSRNLLGRPYQVGERWDVAAWRFEKTEARMISDPSHLETRGGHGGIFHYEVLASGDETRVQVTQLEEYGLPKVDPKVASLVLSVGAGMTQTHKVYQILDRSGHARAVPVSPEGIHSAITGLELFALDVPELIDAESSRVQTLPTLPDGLQRIAVQAGYTPPDPAKSQMYELDDFFGRQVQAIWQQGDPWPAYLKTNNGVAILIRKGGTS